MAYLSQESNHSKYDLVLCDPPTVFDTISADGKKIVISCNKNFDIIASAAAQAVKVGGYLVLFCNSKSLRVKKWNEMIESALDKSSFRFAIKTHLYASEDFMDDKRDPDLKGICYCRID